ncbi:MAG: LysR family transcriptional regulator [Myxococcales bacterium]|nr:MAG: LysR family transcriptional regulator [Myxococcales bacterium]
MVTPDPSWELYRSFLAVLDHGSLSAAARALGLAQPTLGRHIDQLQEQLGGLVLFTRSPHGLVPTETAHDLAGPARTMAAAAQTLVRMASGASEAAAGTVRVTASEIIGAEVLPGVLAPFRERYPQIALELVLSNRSEDLLRREADIAVRMVRPTQSGLRARRLGETALGLYGHRRYLDRHGVPRSLDDLSEHTLIGVDRDLAPLELVRSMGLPSDPTRYGVRTDNQLGQMAALRAGLGLGVCQENIARRDPDLVRVLPTCRAALDLWLTLHEDQSQSLRVRLLYDHLAAGLTDFLAPAG